MKKKIEKTFDELWPICRSITGKGYQTSLDILSRINSFKKINFNSGSKIFDWKVPDEWNIKDAYIKYKGKKIIDFKKNNLHVVGYSMPVKKKLDFKNLKNNLFFLKKQPTAIPYLTSYYKKTWGFCLKFNQYKKLNPQGVYEVVIDSSFKNGKLTVGESYFLGNSPKEIMFSSYLCHPSMANNELSGPLVLTFLASEFRKKFKYTRYSYRFVILPETVGSIAYLSRYWKVLKKNLIAGYHLSCIGDAAPYTFKQSRKENSLADKAGINFVKNFKNSSIIKFNPAIGSDERQYCSPGIDLPFCSFSRSIYAKYSEYHTSLDNKSLISFEKIQETINDLLNLIFNFENNYVYKNKFNKGEPFLSKRNLFRTLSIKNRDLEDLSIWWLLNYSDGKHDLFDISEKSGLKMNSLIKTAKILEQSGLLQK